MGRPAKYDRRRISPSPPLRFSFVADTFGPPTAQQRAQDRRARRKRRVPAGLPSNAFTRISETFDTGAFVANRRAIPIVWETLLDKPAAAPARVFLTKECVSLFAI